MSSAGWDEPALELVPSPCCCRVPSQSRGCRLAGGWWQVCLGRVLVAGLTQRPLPRDFPGQAGGPHVAMTHGRVVGGSHVPRQWDFHPVRWLLSDLAALCPPPSPSWGAKGLEAVSPAWPGSPRGPVPVPTAVLPVRFGHCMPWESGRGAAELEGPRHYLMCFEL